MKAAIYETFGGPLTIQDVPDPHVSEDGVIIRVEASGICRSDWHGWMGHDADIRLPHVPGHELAGVVVQVGKDVRMWRPGDRVTVPFAVGCGYCPLCLVGDQHICDNYFQPGFTAWGSFAQYVAIKYADTNLVRLPDEIDFVGAATLGCRFITSFRAIVAQGKVSSGEWVVVYGCGGVGLSAIMIASAMGAQVIGVDIRDEALVLAESIGANYTLNAAEGDDVVNRIHELTQGGAHVSIDALGSQVTCRNSILSLRKRGRHVQVGLMLADEKDAMLPMDKVIARELEIYGSHGMQAHQYPAILSLMMAGKIDPGRLVTKKVNLEESITVLESMGEYNSPGMTVITEF
jgi:alcohol dehydrogenase